jgi:hypothetical protein
MDRLINTDDRIQQWMHIRSGMPIQKEFRGIAREVDGVIIAAFGYDSFQGLSCQLHAVTDSPTGFNRVLLRTGFEVPFIQWQYQKLIGIIQAGNAKSLNFAKRLGFEEFAVLKDAHPSGALHFFALDRKDCRWIPAEHRACQAALVHPKQLI